jgi:cytochrome P450
MAQEKIGRQVDRLVQSFDHWDPDLAADPYPVYQTLRDQCPVAHSDQYDGFWVLSHYADIDAAAQDTATFSSRSISIPVEIGLGGLRVPPLDQDPPEHTRFRRLLLPFFSPARALKLEPLTRQVAVSLIDDFISDGRCDAAEAFAKPLPIAVLAQLLGVEPHDQALFTEWTTAIVEYGATDPPRAAKAGADIYAYFVDLLEARKQDRRDDLLTYLLEAELDGERMSDDERLGCSVLLLLAGTDTTWSTLGSFLWYLAQDAEARRRITSDQTNTIMGIEELLRAFAPTSVARITTREALIRGQCIAENEPVLLPFPAANRDERVFPEPDQVLLTRSPNRHLAFGSGAHRCIGAHLARMELRVALEEFLGRIPNFHLADPEGVVWKAGPIRGPRRLELAFE